MHADATRPSLISRIRDPSNHAAWVEFESGYRDLILRYARRRGLNATDAEDVLQLVMLRLIKVIPRFEYDPRRGRFHDYLYRVAHSAIVDWQRCPQARLQAVSENEVVSGMAAAAEAPCDAEWEAEWRNHHLRRALAHVRQTSDAKSLEVFERLLAGESVAEIAEAFSMTSEAVNKVKQRMRDRVQERIAEQVREEEA